MDFLSFRGLISLVLSLPFIYVEFLGRDTNKSSNFDLFSIYYVLLTLLDSDFSKSSSSSSLSFFFSNKVWSIRKGKISVEIPIRKRRRKYHLCCKYLKTRRYPFIMSLIVDGLSHILLVKHKIWSKWDPSYMKLCIIEGKSRQSYTTTSMPRVILSVFQRFTVLHKISGLKMFYFSV